MGSALFFVYALPPTEPYGWRKPLLAWAAFALVLSSLGGLLAQTVMMAGSVELGLTSESLAAMVTMTSVGKAAIIRTGFAAIAALFLWRISPGRPLWVVTGVLGTLCAASFAWMGHAADTEVAGGLWHLLADMVHALAAATWIGALVGFAFLARTEIRHEIFVLALRRFSAIGLLLVALLAGTGLANAWFLVGLDQVAGLPGSAYGRLLMIKLALFAGMLGLAAANRFYFSRPNEEAAHGSGARWSVAVETVLGLAVLGIVAWLGMLEPPFGS